MRLKYTTDVSIGLTTFYLKITGFWLAVNRVRECFRSVAVIYTAFTVLFCLGIQIRGLYFCWADFTISTFIACNAVGLVMNFSKLFLVFIQKKKFLQLIRFMQKNFWHSNYDFYEKRIVASVKKMCTYLVCTFSFFSQFTVVSYCIRPAISNVGKNESDRALIFPMWLDLPLSKTPYFEITYVIQALSLYQSGVSYLCFDNIFSIMCLHAAGQFRILQYRMTNIHKVKNLYEDNENSNKDVLYLSDVCVAAFRECIRQHQILIEFCKIVDEVFRVIMLLQVLTFSMLVCLAGYQLFLVDLNVPMRISIIFFLSANMCQLWMFTYSCDTMTRESLRVAVAAYEAPWIYLPMDKFGKIIRKDLQIVIMRSRKACQVTACQFFAVSLETYTRIMSTAMSYFTLLKQGSIDPADT
ncbi:odorant receptor 13a-like [Osmia lignaria lignaria]|uniref:odorant receptor 13a-like n=1 Tax=Osmia lignaria lignaria TaxID=1437193 RepID=UPI00402B403E